MKAFTDCMKKGGKIKTRQLGKGKYQRICTLKKKAYLGEIKVRKNPKKR